MSSQTLLIVETDPHALEILPCIVSEHLPHVAIDICTSADELCRKSGVSSYDAVAMSPILLQAYRFLEHKGAHQFVAPLIMIAGQTDRTLAQRFLEKDAFDLIVKPIVPQEAAQTVRLALWQHRLLRLLASKERAWSRFQPHMEAFPHALKAEEEFASKFAAYEQTFQALNTRMRLLLNIEEERALFDMAESVERLTKKRAWDRLLSLCEEGPAQ